MQFANTSVYTNTASGSAHTHPYGGLVPVPDARMGIVRIVNDLKLAAGDAR